MSWQAELLADSLTSNGGVTWDRRLLFCLYNSFFLSTARPNSLFFNLNFVGNPASLLVSMCLQSDSTIAPHLLELKMIKPSWRPSLEGNGEDLEASLIIKRVLRIHQKLTSKVDLKPCPEINGLFTELVEICTKTVNETITRKVLEHPHITTIMPSLRIFCSTAEYHLESHWSTRIAGSSSASEAPEDSSKVHQRLKTFPYFNNYISLTRMELSALASISLAPIQRIAFIGSGPLPLSSLCLSGVVPLLGSPFRPVMVLNIDYDATAISQSKDLCEKLRVKEKMEFLHSDAREVQDLREFDVVYLAALVGPSQKEKEAVLRDVVRKMAPGKIVIVRSAERLRRLMYAEFDPTTEGVLECLDICLVVHPFNSVVNSVIVGKVKDVD